MSFYKLIYAIKMRLSKQMTLNVEVSFDTFGKELALFRVSFGSLDLGSLWLYILGVNVSTAFVSLSHKVTAKVLQVHLE